MVKTFPKRKLKKIDGEYILWHILDSLNCEKEHWHDTVLEAVRATVYNLLREHFRV